MKPYFLDTSALVKQYRTEQGTERVQALFDDQQNALFISELTIVEYTSTLQCLKSQGEITAEAMSNARGNFDNDADGRFVIIGLRGEFIKEAKTLVLQHNLRTLDALQLTSALSFKILSPTFVSADGDLLKAAQASGLTTLNPLE